METDINHLILPLLHILHSLDLVYVYADQTLLESQVRKQLHHFGQHHVAVLEYCERQIHRLLTVCVAVKHLIDPTFLLPVLSVHVLALLHLDCLELLAQFLVQIDNEFAETVLFLVRNAFICPVLELDCSYSLIEIAEIGFEFCDFPADIALGKD